MDWEVARERVSCGDMLEDGTTQEGTRAMLGYMGIDGGGTKTEALICDERGVVLGHALEGPSTLQNAGSDEAEKTLRQAVRSACACAGVSTQDLVAVGWGAGGLDTKRDRIEYEAIRSRLFPKSARVRIENDAVAALFSGTYGEPGIVVVAGTGSIVAGLQRDGTILRAGGWGYLVGDDGSAFDIGRRALRAITFAHDGIAEPTSLGEALCRHLSADSVGEAIASLYRMENPVSTLASFAHRVNDAAEQGDGVARSVLCDSGRVLGGLCLGLLRRLGEDGRRFPVVTVGGAFQSKGFEAAFEEALRREAPGVRIVRPDLRPVCGAVLMALRETGVAVEESVLDNLRGWSAGAAFHQRAPSR